MHKAIVCIPQRALECFLDLHSALRKMNNQIISG
jgi:hypothetical protein